MNARPPGVLLVEPDDVVRLGLRSLIRAECALRVCGETGDGEEALALVRRHRPRVVVCEVELPRLDGIALCQALRSEPDPPQALVYTDRVDQRTIHAAITAGAAGFLGKGASGVTVRQAVRDLATGGACLDGQTATRVLDRLRELSAKAETAELAALSPRELQLVVMIAEGYRNQDIGAVLNLSEKTIRNQLSRLFAKLGFSRREQVAAWAGRYRNQLPRPPR